MDRTPLPATEAVAMTSVSRTELASLHLELLQLERQEERKRQQQLKEDRPLRLVVKDIKDEEKVCLFSLQHEQGTPLPKHGIELGAQVLVSLDGSVTSYYAAVGEISRMHMTLVFAYFRKPGIDVNSIVLVRSAETSDHDQLASIMGWLKRVNTGGEYDPQEPSVPVVRRMFKENERPTAAQDSASASSLSYTDSLLDASQREAVSLSLRNQPLTVIHGPPGTGKTTTIVEVILQHVQRGQRVLVCAPSNKAVDNVMKGVWKKTKKSTCELSMDSVIRLGQLERIDKKVRKFSLKARLENLELETATMRRVHRRPGRGYRTAGRGYRGYNPFDDDYVYDYGERYTAMTLYTSLKNARDDLLNQASVVMSTLTSVRSVDIEPTFDLLVIDECGQATEAACWLAIPFAKKVLLVGDPCQLPPTILSQEAARRGLAVSLMERQMKLHGDAADVVHMLDTQYRMHERIQAWSSENLYGGKLKAAPKVGAHLLTDLPDVRSTSQTQTTLVLVDTTGCRLREARDAKTNSYCNKGEASLAVCHAKSLVQAGLQPKAIGIITPYKQQVALIGDRLRAAGLQDVEVNSVDGYQGREKEAILLSLVRSNGRRQVGFVGDRRRLNVAVTRARRHLFVVCDTDTVCRDDTIRSLVSHIKRNGLVRETRGQLCPHGTDCTAAGDDGPDDDDDTDRPARGFRPVPPLPTTASFEELLKGLENVRF